MTIRNLCIVFFITMAVQERSNAVVTVFTNKMNWMDNVGPFSAITFTEFGLPKGTWLDEQYSFMGVHFTDGSDQIYQSNSFITDGFGLNGALDDATLEFDAPITSIAMDHPGHVKIQLFMDEQLLYTSPTLGGGGTGFFSGIISTESFNKVHLYDIGLVIDNIYFGPPIPAPGALTLLALGFTLRGRRRRTA